MRKQGNHMVDLPQPELDTEEECDYACEEYDIIGIQDYNEFTIVYEVQCVDCHRVGYVEGSITWDLDKGVEWQDE
tara:strand:- start:245 stop:469 length:225 start_codon:yes stop_codon:yes gene_type:complete